MYIAQVNQLCYGLDVCFIVLIGDAYVQVAIFSISSVLGSHAPELGVADEIYLK